MLLPAGAWGQAVNPGEGVSFAQVNFTYAGASQSFSQYGQAFIDYAAIASNFGSTGFINVVTNDGWAVQNAPVHAASNLPGISKMFDLGASGLQTNLQAYVEFSTTPLTSAPVGSFSNFGLAQVQTNAQGDTAVRTAPPGPPPANGGVAFSDSTFSFIFQPNHSASVEQDDNQCGPASVANSMQYLQSRWGIQFGDQHIPGIAGNPPESRVGRLDDTMGRPAGTPISNNQFLSGKLQYLANAGVTGLRLEHQGGDRTGGGGIGDGDFNHAGLTSRDFGATVTADFILNQLARGEDVEMNIRWIPGPGGHWVTLVGGGLIGGRPFVIFYHDAQQDAAGGTGLFDGGYGFSFLTTAGDGTLRFRNFVDGSEARVNFVVSESAVPEPSTMLLSAVGLVGAAMAYRKKNRKTARRRDCEPPVVAA